MGPIISYIYIILRREFRKLSNLIRPILVLGEPQELDMIKLRTLSPEFAKRLHERSPATIGYWDCMRTIGDFVVVHEGKIQEHDPKTQIAKDMLDFLKSSGRMSRRALLRKTGKRG